MRLQDFLSSISKKIILVIAGIIISIGIIYFIWQNKKYVIVKNTIAHTVATKTDSIYKITYDSLHFDELTGRAYLQNIHIGYDTNVVKNMKTDELPYIFLDVKIASLSVTGVKTNKALLGNQMIGDSVVINQPVVHVYFVKPLRKQTNINTEAQNVYDQILGNLTRIKVNHVFLNDINIEGSGFLSKEKVFDVTRGNVKLTDVLIDSAHNLDTSRTLFCKDLALQIFSFTSYNNNRPEVSVSNINFAGNDLLSFQKIDVNRFESDSAGSIKLLHADALTLKGIDPNEIVKNKNIVIDSISCAAIKLYQPPFENFKKPPVPLNPRLPDTIGFMHVYSIDLKRLRFPHIEFVLKKNSKVSLGNVSVLVNRVKADQIINVKNDPVDFSKEVEIAFEKINVKSDENDYTFSFLHSSLNSLQKELKIQSLAITPVLGEKAFAGKARFQKDRYDVTLANIALKGIDMKNLLAKKVFATDLIIGSTSAKIYRDLTKPLDGKNKVGHYPSQLLQKLATSVNIAHASLPAAFIQYKEHEKVSDSTGVVTFINTDINISNITNLPEAIQKNNATNMAFNTEVLGVIPVRGNFKFFLDSRNGKFEANGNVSGFDAVVLNKVSVPMALIRLHDGKINAVDFHFTGNDVSASGDFVMKYNDLKVDVLKRDEESKKIKKKGLLSLIANVVIKNNNPNNGNLRKETPIFERDPQKSFFNLVWKTVFTGMKKTVGIP